MQEIKTSVVLYSGFLLAFMGLAGMGIGLEPLASFSAPLFWWGYVALSDSLIFHLKGESLIISRTDDFLWMASWSAAVWLVFEALNSALGVWQYINLPASTPMRWGWYLAFGSALLPALHQSVAYLSPRKIGGKAAPRPFRPGNRTLNAIQAAGIAAFFLALIFPRTAFPLAALALPLVLDPLSLRLNAPSLLGLLEKGERGKLAALAAAGLVCGLAGEAWLQAAGPSRVYDLGFASWLPMMGLPLAGFAAFPLLALSAFPLYSLTLFLKGGGTDLLGAEMRPVAGRPPWLAPASYLFLFLIYGAGFMFLDARSAALLIVLP